VVFAEGIDYPSVRIPSVVMCGSGTVLAFAEGRQARGDHSENHIVLKRSLDAGRTWGVLQVVAREGRDSLNDPSAVVDRRSGRVVLHYSRFAQGYHTNSAPPGYDDPRSSRNYVVFSDDDGATWSAPMEVTRVLKRPHASGGIAACGIGIQLRRGSHAGRLVHAAYQFVESRLYESYTVYSDDGGASWHQGEVAPAAGGENTFEPQTVELADGRVMMNVRTKTGRRFAGTSSDGGRTFCELTRVEELVDPTCQGSILRYSDPLDGEPSRLLFCNCGSGTARDTGTVRLSRDEGRTWPVSRVLYPGGFAYSCLTRLPDGSIGCLFEADRYATITFARFSLGWLTGDDETGA
jgi:sialidase-1